MDKILSLNMDLEPHHNQLASPSRYYLPTFIEVAWAHMSWRVSWQMSR